MDEKQSSEINSHNQFSEKDSSLDVQINQQEDKKQENFTILNSSRDTEKNLDNNHSNEIQLEKEIENVVDNQLQQNQNTETSHSNKTSVKEETIKSDNLSIHNDGSIDGGINAAIGDNSIQNQNVINLFTDKIYSNEQNRKKLEEEPFIDPTTDLLYKSKNKFDLSSSDLIKYSQVLIEENLIVISCFDPEISSEFAYALGDSIENICEQRFLTFKGKNSKRSDLTIELLAENQELGKLNNKITHSTENKNLIIIDGVSVSAQSFWDSLIVYSPLTADQIKQELKKLNRLLICIARPETIEQIYKKKQQRDLFFTYYPIPFLDYLLKSKFAQYSAEKIQQLKEQIIAQKSLNLWGDSEKEFYDNIYSYIRNDLLILEIEKRENIRQDNNTNIIAIEQKLKPIRSNEIFIEDDDLENVVLYVAIFFPGLNPDDFENIVSQLLEGRTVTVNIESQIAAENGEIKKVKKEIEKPLQEIWQKNPDKILRKKCHLKAVLYQGSARVIDFDLPYLRKELKKYLEEEYPLFLRNQFNRIQELGLLFDSSLKVTENVINLYTNMAVSYPERYGEDWLVRIVLIILHSKQQLANYTKQQFEMQINSSNVQQEEIIQLLQDFDASNIQLDLVFSRISDLVREMLNYPQLQNVVNSFLEQLIAAKRHDAVLIMVKRLRFAPQFDEFYWLRQLLERGNKIICDETYKFLYHQAKQSGFRIYELLAKIRSWLPESSRKNYSQSNKYALFLFRDYCLETTENFPIKSYGQWQSKHPLFGVICKESSEEYLNILVKFLVALLNAKIDENVLELVASLLAEWNVILNGFSQKSIHPESSKILIQLLKKIVGSINQKQQNKILNFWRSLTEHYYELMEEGQRKIEEFEAKKYSEKFFKKLDDDLNQINRRRQLINQLINDFKKLTLINNI